jgi:hypothetical protein
MGKTERKTIKVISVANWRDAGKAKVLEFGGEDHVNYETWSPELAEHIKVGTTIEADVEFTENISGDKTYHHNKVIQIYVDGQPVKSRSRGFTPDSPEKISSIESQKRADLICQLWIADKITENDPLVVKARAWLSLLGITPAPTAATKSKSLAADTATGEVRNIPPPGASMFNNAGEFLTACSKPPLKLNKTQVLAALKQVGIKAPDTLEGVNFADAYQLMFEAQREAQK